MDVALAGVPTWGPRRTLDGGDNGVPSGSRKRKAPQRAFCTEAPVSKETKCWATCGTVTVRVSSDAALDVSCGEKGVVGCDGVEGRRARICYAKWRCGLGQCEIEDGRYGELALCAYVFL